MPALLALALSSVLQCRVEDARYALRTKPAVSAYFKPVESGADWPSGLVLVTHFGDTGHDYWWLPWNGGTDDLQNVASTTDVDAPGWRPPSPDGGPRPLGNMEYIATNAHYDVIDSTPKRGGTAPAHILLSHLGDGAWHGGVYAQRDSAPKQFFDVVSCRETHR